MRPDVVFRKGTLRVSQQANKDWLVKIPTVKHRLHRTGTVGLDMVQRFDLQDKKGILYIDMTKKAYVFVPKELLEKSDYFDAAYSGVKDAIRSYPIKQIINEYKLSLVPILDEAKIPTHTGLAAQVSSKFGI